MTSAITVNGINTNYPVAGQDNDSAGFRSNFSSISQGLTTASSEISALQIKTVLTADLATNTPVSNNLNGSSVYNGAFKNFNGIATNWGTTPSNANISLTSTSIDVSAGPLQAYTLQKNQALNFINWAGNGYDSRIRVHVANANASTLTTPIITGSSGQFSCTSYTNGLVVGQPVIVSGALANNTTASATGIISNGTGSTVGNVFTPTGSITGTFSSGMTLSGSNVTGSPSIITANSATFAGSLGVSLTVTGITGATGNFSCSTSSVSLYAGMPVTVSGTISNTSTTLSNVLVTGTSGTFSCNTATLTIGMAIVVTGVNTGTGTINGYSSGTTYYVIGSPTGTTFQLSSVFGGGNVTTVFGSGGTTTGLTFTVQPPSLVGYSNPTTYYIIGSPTTNSFQLSSTSGGGSITTIVGTPSGLTFTLNILNVTSVSAGTLSTGLAITGSGVTTGTYITGLGSGTGSTGTYLLNQYATGTPTTGTSYTVNGTAQLAASGTVTGSTVGVGTITGYTNPTTYYISATNGATTFTLTDTLAHAIAGTNPITTGAGSTLGLTFTVGSRVQLTTANTGVFHTEVSTNFIQTLGGLPTFASAGTTKFIFDAWTYDGGANVYVKHIGVFN
jgi:hypothetical protein